MVRLTADVLLQAENYLNACGDREINLRGLKIPVIENLAILQDQYDVIDFSDNDIKRLDYFPLMRRLCCLLLCNNSITRIADDLHTHLPRLQAVILTNNKISHLHEIDNLASVTQLDTLSLMENPIVLKPFYRIYAIFRLRGLKCLDFAKVTRTEREEAAKFFKSSSGAAVLAQIAAERQQSSGGAPGSGAVAAPAPPAAPARAAQEYTDAQKAQIKRAIERASTKEDIDRIEQQLQTGTFPFEASDHSSSLVQPHRPQQVMVDDGMDLD